MKGGWENINSDTETNQWKLWRKQFHVGMGSAKKAPDKLLIFSELILAGLEHKIPRLVISLVSVLLIWMLVV